MSVEAAGSIVAFDSTLPRSSDDRREGDDHIRLIKAVLQSAFPGMSGPMLRTVSRSISVSLGSADAYTIQKCSATLTLTLADLSTVPDTWFVIVSPRGGSVTLQVVGTDTIDGASSASIPAGSFALLARAGTMYTLVHGILYSEALAGLSAIDFDPNVVLATNAQGVISQQHISTTGRQVIAVASVPALLTLLGIQHATDEIAGLMQLATDAETVAGTADDVAVTPAGLDAFKADNILPQLLERYYSVNVPVTQYLTIPIDVALSTEVTIRLNAVARGARRILIMQPMYGAVAGDIIELGSTSTYTGVITFKCLLAGSSNFVGHVSSYSAGEVPGFSFYKGNSTAALTAVRFYWAGGGTFLATGSVQAERILRTPL